MDVRTCAFASLLASSLFAAPLAAQTVPIALGANVTGNIGVEEEIDRYSFSASPGQVVTLDRVAASDSTVLNWHLEDAYGRELLDGPSSMQDLGPVALLGGDYVVVITAEGDFLPSYEFRVADSTGTVAAVALNTPVQGSIDEPGRIDRYTFVATPGQELALDLLASSNATRLDWRLSDAFGRELVPWTASLADAGPFPLMGGPYTLEVRGEVTGGDYDLATYEFQVREPVVDVNATSIGATLVGEIAGSADLDVWTFGAAAGQVLFLDLVASSNTNQLQWMLENEQGYALLPLTGNINDAGPLTLGAGNYTLTVKGEPNGGHFATGTYTVDLLEVDDVEANTSIGAPIQGSIDVPSQADTYTFTAAAGQTVVIDTVVSSNKNGLDFVLRDMHGRDVVPLTTSLSDLGPLTLMGGTYELIVQGESSSIGQVGTYDVRVLVPTLDQAAVAFDTLTSGDIAGPGDADEWTFSAVPNQTIQLDLVSSSNASGLNWTVLDANGREVLPKALNLLDSAPIKLLGGNYTLRVESELSGGEWRTGTYDFQVRDLGLGSFTPSGVPLALESVVSSNLAVSGEVDDYLLSLSADTRVFVDLLSGAGSLRWSLFDPAGQPFFALQAASTASIHNQGPFDLPAGDYTLRLEDNGAATPSYAFELREVFDQSAAYTLGTSVAGATPGPGAVVEYTFAAANGQRLYFDLVAASTGNKWSLIDPVGTPVWNPLLATSTTSSDQGPIELAAGTYTLRFDPDNDAVPSFEFRALDSLDTSSPITVDTPVAAVFTTPGSSQEFTFTAPAGQRIFADLTAGASGTSWELRDPVGQALFSKLANSTTNGDAGPITLAGGAYRVVVHNDSDDLPTIQFTLHEVLDSIAPVQAGTQAAGTVPSPGQFEQHQVTVANDGDRLYFDNQLGSGAKWSLRDPLGLPVFLNQSLTLTSTGDEGPHALAAGVYTLEFSVTSGSAAYAFEVVLVQDVDVALAFDVQQLGSVLTSGGEARFDFTADAGQRLYFDSTAIGGGLTWTLADELGVSNGLASNQTLNLTLNSKSGPYDLAAGDYRLTVFGANDTTPAYDFVVRNVDVDLLPRTLATSVGTFLSDQVGAQPFEVSWAVDNIGGGPHQADVPWTDRIVLSRNPILGDADDVTLAEFQNAPPLAPKASYSRTELVELPPNTPVGEQNLYVAVDVFNELVEFGGETNNSARQEIQVVPDVHANGECITFDLADGTTFPAGSTVALSGYATGLQSLLNVSYVLDVSTSTQLVCGLDSNFDGVLDENDNLNGDTGASGAPECTTGTILDSEIGASILLNAFLAQNAATSHSAVLFSAGAQAMDLGPEPFQQTWLAPFDRDQDGDLEPDFETAMRSLYSTGTPFCGIGTGAKEFTYIDVKCGTSFKTAVQETTATFMNAPFADQNLVLFLTDGLPEPGGFPNPAEVAALGDLGIDFKAFQLGAAEVTAELQSLVDSIDAHPDSKATARSILDVNDLLFELVQSIQVVGITVNGVAADSVDATGRFFHLVQLQPGANVFDVLAFDASGGLCSAQLTLFGAEPGDDTFDLLSDVTTSIVPTYTDTTYNLKTGVLGFQASLRNDDVFPVAGPLLMVVDNLPAQGVTVLNADGVTPDGKPYFVFLDQSVHSVLDPGESSPTRPLQFHNPNLAPIAFEPVYLALGNHAPFFVSAPTVKTAATLPYAYSAHASDPDGHVLTYSLASGPAGMTVDAQSGAVAWTPGAPDLGAHQVTVEVTDGWGGTALQTYNLTVVDQLQNAPPVFASAPNTHAAVGAHYSYQATAVDPDGDALTYTLSSGPAGASVDATGLVAWDFALPGVYDVLLVANDGNGGTATQGYQLTVGQPSANPGAPVIFGSPSGSAVVDRLYIYQPTASDPDLGDVLTFSLPTAPAGMAIDPVTGLVTWTPHAGQVGPNAVELRVADQDGASAGQAWTLSVFTELGNLPPVIESVPGLLAFTGATYAYQVIASDPDGQPLTFDLIAPAPGMAISSTGLFTWTPSVPGPVSVAIRVTDLGGATGSQVYVLQVAAPNGAPVITSSPVTAALAGGTYLYDVEAGDPDAHVLFYSLDQAPAGMTVNPATGLVKWTPSPADLGPHPVTVRVADAYLGTATQSWTVDVAADLTPPTVELAFSMTPGAIGEPVQVCVLASDDAGLASLALTANGAPVPLDVFGCAQYTSNVVGIVDFEARVFDTGGNLTVAHELFQFVDLVDPTAPVVTLISPPAGALISTPTEIVADITDDTPAVLLWRVELARGEHGEFDVIGSGAGETLGNALALLDPTSLPNDSYRVRIVGNDGVAEEGIEFRYEVSSNFKLGNFTTEFTDLVTTVAGIPLVVTRTYHSLDTAPAEPNNFGAGWRLGLSGDVEDSAGEYENPPTGLVALLGAESFVQGTRVYATGPDGRRHGFTFEATAMGYPVPFLYSVRLAPDEGVEHTLEVVDLPSVTFALGGKFNNVGVPYNPTTYELTTPEGVSYILHEQDGLRRVEDANGNWIDVLPEGLFSSTGAALLFERDAEGRIVRIDEPAVPGGTTPGFVEYDYDGEGNLVQTRDLMGAPTDYLYEDPNYAHLLTQVIGPDGLAQVSTVYDDDGHLVAQCGPGGDPLTLTGCVTFENDALAGTQSIVDANGYRTDLFFDEFGNIPLQREWKNDFDFVDITREFDAHGNMLSETLPGVGPTLYTYDDEHRILTETDPSGDMLVFAYDADCGKLVSRCDVLGNCATFVYDGECNLVEYTDQTGRKLYGAYDDIGLLTSMIDGEGRTWSWEYDAYGGLLRSLDPFGNEELYDFGVSNELHSFVDRNGRRIEWTYDAAHRPLTETWDDGRVITFAYDTAGKLIETGDLESNIRLEYWNSGVVRSVDTTASAGALGARLEFGFDNGSGVLQIGHDGNLNLTHVTDSLGGVTEYRYGFLDRVETILQYGAPSPGPVPSGGGRGASRTAPYSAPAGTQMLVSAPGLSGTGTGLGTLPSVRDKRFDKVYSDVGLELSFHRYADLAGTLPVADTSFTFGCTACPGSLESIVHRRPDLSVIHGLAFERGPTGILAEMSDAEGSHTYLHDGTARLITATHPVGGPQPNESYAYDAAGNRSSSHLSSTYTYSYDLVGLGDQLWQDDAYDYAYDPAGHLVRRTERASGDYVTYDWDHRNRLTDVVRYDAADVEQARARYTYDVADRRVRSEENGVVRHFVYDGRNPLLVLDDAGHVLERRMYEREVDDVLADEVGGVTRWYLRDQVGSVRDLIDDAGNSLGHFAYDSFGRVVDQTGATTELGFQSRTRSSFSGLMDFRARQYAPELGRFLSIDPKQPFQYTALGNSPLHFVDPLGETEFLEYCVLIAVVGATDFPAALADAVNELYKNVLAGVTGAPTPGIDPFLKKFSKALNGKFGPPSLPDSPAALGKKLLGLHCALKKLTK